MAGKVTVTYYHHSGFSVAAGRTLMVFDYWRGDENWHLPKECELTKADFAPFDQVLVFISHDHPDHFDEIVYTFDKWDVPVTYVVSHDFPIGKSGRRMKVGDKITVGDVTVTAYPSTDKGVSFLAEAGGVRIFHAGDLNLWHWREESELIEILDAERQFEEAMASLENVPMDLCFFPLDPRMGGLFDAGANHFLWSVKPRVFIPMHWYGRSEVAREYARKSRTKYTETLALTAPREKVEIDFGMNTLTVRTFQSQPLRSYAYAAPVREKENDPFQAVNPFMDSDLPVALDAQAPNNKNHQ